jgi:POT family proton-dependent oligopeptide transporter
VTAVATTEKTSALQRLKEHPRGFWFVFWGELAERSSFYGMRTLLAVYLTDKLGYDDAHGASIMTFFMASCYVAPLLGGWLADRVLGRYKTILYFSAPYIAGHILLGGIESRWAMYVSLALLALGSGSIKPNTSTLMGAMYEEQKKSALLTEAFSYFYAAINIGSAVSTIALPVVKNQWGYGPALMIPAALMAAAFAAFAVGKKHYPHEDVRSLPPKTSEQRAAERLTLTRIAGLFAMIAVFWFVYDQAASTWIYFAKKHCELTIIPGHQVSPEQVQGLNPVLIVVLTPVFNWIWETWKRRRGGRDVADTTKMLIGFYIVIGCMAMMAIAGFYARGDTKITIWWLNVATFVITLSELCISVVGLEFAFKVAAPGTKSVVTAAFLFTVFVGDFFGGFFDRFYDSPGGLGPGMFFTVQAVVATLTALLFQQLARKFEKQADQGTQLPSTQK